MSSTVRAAAARCCRCCCWAADSGPDCHPAAVTWPVTETALFPRPRQARKCGPRLKRKISAESKGCWWSTFRGRQKVSDVRKFSQALYLFPPRFFAPSTNWNSCSPSQSYKKILQKDILLKKKIPYGQIECKSLHTVKTTLLFKRKKKQPHQSAWMTCAFRWTVVKLGFLIRAHCLDSLESQSLWGEQRKINTLSYNHHKHPLVMSSWKLGAKCNCYNPFC